ncbi:MAG: glycosyltransferase family 2 protein [Deltaproteobacteria bacterium]|nr:MAG: glycosyltransferase family 2 protein [Deltaproteobacteria bacterium]
MGMGIGISGVVVCFNEEENIERCLKSLTWTDEIVVVDSYSTDNTVSICKKYTDRVYQREWPGINKQKEYAVSLAKNEWVFILDADEVVSEELKEEIIKRLSSDKGKYDGYMVKRHTYYLGRWINHGGWYPDYKLRLFKKQKGYFVGKDPHDKIAVSGDVAKLNGEIYHFTYKDIAHHIRTINSFSDVVANNEKEKERFIIPKMLFKPAIKFLETYVYKLGFLDGIPGFIISVLSSYYVFIKYAKLWEKRFVWHKGLSHS